ncbi:MAG: hypothetical protein AB7E51_02360 [Pseudodesulfovibrio sp.]|uniref:hypothetical protein n=1 Tax=Pseudodesulfovibrio sp. TaxID=2035812 RepID=UPI003D0B8D9C
MSICDPIVRTVAPVAGLVVGESCLYGEFPQKLRTAFAFVSETSHVPDPYVSALRKSNIQIFAQGVSFATAEAMAAAVEAMPGGQHVVDGITYTVKDVLRLNGPFRIQDGAFSMNFTAFFSITT